MVLFNEPPSLVVFFSLKRKDIFDAPTSKTTPLEERMALIEGLNIVPSENVNVMRLDRVESMQHLLDKARELYKYGTDSILLRAPYSQYEKGRSKCYRRAVVSLKACLHPFLLLYFIF